MFVLYVLHSPPEVWWDNITHGQVHVPKMGGPETCEQFAQDMCKIMTRSECCWMVPGTVDPRDD